MWHQCIDSRSPPNGWSFVRFNEENLAVAKFTRAHTEEDKDIFWICFFEKNIVFSRTIDAEPDVDDEMRNYIGVVQIMMYCDVLLQKQYGMEPAWDIAVQEFRDQGIPV